MCGGVRKHGLVVFKMTVQTHYGKRERVESGGLFWWINKKFSSQTWDKLSLVNKCERRMQNRIRLIGKGLTSFWIGMSSGYDHLFCRRGLCTSSVWVWCTWSVPFCSSEGPTWWLSEWEELWKACRSSTSCSIFASQWWLLIFRHRWIPLLTVSITTEGNNK